MQLETERLVLRPPRLEDVDDLLEFAADEAVMHGIGSEPGGREVALEPARHGPANVCVHPR